MPTARGPGAVDVVGPCEHLPAGALDQLQVVVDARRDVALLEQVEGAGLELGEVGRRRGARRGARGGAGRPRAAAISRGVDELRLVLGQLEALVVEGLDDIVALLGGDEDEVGVVGGDDEDGDASEGEGRGQLYDPSRGVEPGADDGEDQVVMLRKLDRLSGLLGQLADEGLEDVLGPGAVADDGHLDRGDADVEEAMLLAVEAKTLQLVLGSVARRAEGLGVREEDAQDGLEEGRVEVKRNVDEGVGAFLLTISP